MTTRSRALTTRQKREVRKIVKSTIPQEWTPLFEVDPCGAITNAGEECPQQFTVALAQAAPGVTDTGELMLHRWRGGIWMEPTYPEETSCTEDYALERTQYLRWALVRLEANSTGAQPPMDLFNEVDWAEGDAIRRGEHVWSGNSAAHLVQPTGTGTLTTPRVLQSEFFAEQSKAAACADQTRGYEYHLEPCSAGVLTMPSFCVYHTEPQKPWFWSAERHCPRGMRLRDNERLVLILARSILVPAALPKDLTIWGQVSALVSSTSQ